MNNSGCNSDNISGESSAKTVLDRRLQELDINVERCADVENGTKNCYNHEDKRSPTAISGNYTVHGGDGLVILDVDVTSEDFDELPDWVTNLPSTFIVKSPHDGYHVYYAVKDDDGISSSKTDWGSLRYEGWYTIGPGSTLDHTRCPDGKNNCPGKGVGRYRIECNKSIPTLSSDDLERLREICASDGIEPPSDTDEEFQPVDDPNDDLVARAEANMRDFQANCTGLAFDDLMDLLNGGTGTIDGLRRDDETIDRDKADLEALWMLFGVMRYAREDADSARQLAYIAYTHYCKETPYGKDGRKRKWLTRPNSYRRNRLNAAIRGFDFGGWHRWRRRKHKDGLDPDDYRNWTDDYSDVAYDIALALLDVHCGLFGVEDAEQIWGVDLSDIPPALCPKIPPGGSPGRSCDLPDFDFPSPREMRETAAKVDTRSESTYKSVYQRLQRRGMVKIACIEEGGNYQIYPTALPDPPEAEWVMTEGEEYTLDGEPPESSKESSEQELMTDGGTQMSSTESHDKLERIRQARNGNANSTDAPDVYTCPIEECSRTVIGNVGDLRNHVSQSSDDAHRHRTLDENLEVVIHWEDMNWDPGYVPT